MNIVLDHLFIKARVVHNVFVTPEELITYTSLLVWWNPSTWFLPRQVDKTTRYVLHIKYTSEDGKRMEQTSSHSEYQYMKTKFDEVIRQVKMQDHEITDREFEEAVMNNGKDKK